MPRRLKILIAESREFCGEARAILSRIGDVELADLNRVELCRVVHDFDLIWVRLRNYIDAEVLDHAPGVQALATPTTGLNHIDLRAAGSRGVQVFSLKGEVEFLKDVRATAEHTIALSLALLRRIPQAARDTELGGWNRDAFRGSELHQKTVGVVGYGRLGRLVARYFHAFGANVVAADPYVSATEAEDFVKMMDLESLLPRADLVTLHVNFSEANTRFFGLAQFQAMKPGAWFINTARGELVDELALIKALQTGHLAGAAVDVLSGEGSGGVLSNPLLKYASGRSNVLVTPHIGGCTAESMAKTEIFLAEKICSAYFKNGTLREMVSFAALA